MKKAAKPLWAEKELVLEAREEGSRPHPILVTLILQPWLCQHVEKRDEKLVKTELKG